MFDFWVLGLCTLFMVSSFEVWVACPSVSFFFARLGVALGVSGDFFPLVGDYIFEGCGLSVVLGELSPILGQLLADRKSVV